MQQWVQTVSSLIHCTPEANLKGKLKGCTSFELEGKEIRATTVTSNNTPGARVPLVIGFSAQGQKTPPATGFSEEIEFAFVLEPAPDTGGVYIQILQVLRADENKLVFGRAGKQDWFMPDTSPRS